VIARAQIHLYEILQRAGRIIERRGSVGSRCHGLELGQFILEIFADCENAREPEIRALADRNVRLLRGPKIRDGDAGGARERVEASRAGVVESDALFEGPAEIGGRAERGEADDEQEEAHR
jgi:hypothetical protein